MPRMDWSAPTSSEFGPGVYLAEVAKCEVRHSKKPGNAPYLNVEWHDASALGSGGIICWDVIMMAGNGRGLGQAKLRALGFDEQCQLIEPDDLVGRRAWIRVALQKYGDKENLKVLSEFEPEFSAGYWPESAPPDGVSSPTMGSSDEPW